MLFEQRVYTMRPQALPQFFEAQLERGFAPVRPILERLIGYFGDEARDQVVHLYRFDNYDDWHARLQGLYSVQGMEPYFKKVRALMIAQENRFLAPAPAPLRGLNPLWEDGSDWLPGSGAARLEVQATSTTLVEQTTVQLLPGSLPRYWEGLARLDARAAALFRQRLFGCFFPLVGRFHQVITYRHHSGRDEQATHARALADDGGWQAFLATMAEATVTQEQRLLVPADPPEMSPLFGR